MHGDEWWYEMYPPYSFLFLDSVEVSLARYFVIWPVLTVSRDVFETDLGCFWSRELPLPGSERCCLLTSSRLALTMSTVWSMSFSAFSNCLVIAVSQRLLILLMMSSYLLSISEIFSDIVFSIMLSIYACCLRSWVILFCICSTILVSTEIWESVVMADGCAEELSAVFWTDVATMDNGLDQAFFGGEE